MKKDKKKFKDTKIGKFLVGAAPAIVDVVDDFFPPVKILTKLISDDPDLTPEQKAESLKLVHEYELEVMALEVDDKKNARWREVEVSKIRKIDWMMVLTGLVGLASYGVIVYAIIWIPEVAEREIFIHLIGMVEGVVVTSLFSYYYGTSKNESLKT